MEPYASDDEQLDAIKNWWKTNGSAVITGVIIGLALIFGWQYWNSYQRSHAEEASLHYTLLLQALAQEDASRAQEQADALLEDYSESAYAALAALQLGKAAVERGDAEQAVSRLEWVLEHVEQPELITIARLRLARVHLAEGRLEAAEAQLEQIDAGSFTAEVEELKGDLYLARNQPEKARAAYQTALTASGGNNPLLAMKLDNLPAPPEEG